MSADRRTARDERRRRLGQNFLRSDSADRLIGHADIRPGELVVEPGAGTGALTLAMAKRGARVLAIEIDRDWADRLEQRARTITTGEIRVVRADFLSVRQPTEFYRVVGCPPFGRTTALLRRLLDEPNRYLERIDLIVQWEVAKKRAATPADTLLSTTWAPWWAFHLGRRVPAREFRPVPRVDAGMLTVVRRRPPILPTAMAPRYAAFVRSEWPFPSGREP